MHEEDVAATAFSLRDLLVEVSSPVVTIEVREATRITNTTVYPVDKHVYTVCGKNTVKVTTLDAGQILSVIH